MLRRIAVCVVTLMFIVALAMAGRFAAVSAATGGLVLGTSWNLSVSAGNSGYAKVAASGDNRYVVWADRGMGSDLEILFRSSDNGGAGFNSSKNLSQSPGVDSSFPAIAVNGQNVYVVWHEYVPGQGREVMFAMSANGGGSFTAPVNISNTAGDSAYPLVAAANTYVWIAWNDLDGSRVGLNLAHSEDEGHNFAAERLSDYIALGSEGLAAAGDYGYVSGVHLPPAGSPAIKVWRAHYPTPGNFATTSQTITTNVNGGTTPVIAAADNKVYAFWRTRTNPAPDEVDEKYYLSHSVDGGAFAVPAVYNHGSATGIRSGYAAPLAITAASGQGACVAWLEANDPSAGPRTGTLYAVGITSGGTVGSHVALASLSGTREYIGGLALSSGDGFVHATWHHETDTNTEVHAASSRDGGMSFPVSGNVSDNPSDSGAPAIASSGTEAYVAWMDYLWGNWEIAGRQISTEAEDVALVNLNLVQAPLAHTYYADGKPTKIRAIVSNRYSVAKTASLAISYDDASGYHVHTEDVVLKPGVNDLYLPQQEMSGERFIRPTGDSINLTLAINPLLGETDTTNNVKSVTKSITQTRPLRVVYRPLASSTDAEPYPTCADLTEVAKASASMIEGMYPVDERETKTEIDCMPLIVPPDVTETYTTSSGGTEESIKDSVFDALTVGTWVGNVDKVVGITRPGWLKDNGVDAIGLAPLPGKSAIVDSGYRGGSIAAHEVAHNFGWVPKGWPGATGAHLNYVAAEGYWVARGQPMTGRYDLMNWAILDNAADTVPTKSWIGKSTYDFLAQQLAKAVSDPAVIGVRGTVTAGGEVTFRPAYRIEGDIDLPPDNPGAYRLRSLDASDAVLGETGFDLDFSAPPDVAEGTLGKASFAYRIPDLAGVKRIVLLYGGEELGSIAVSDNAPVVDITYPLGGEILVTGEQLTATWTATDADPDSTLTYTVALSDDNGLTWVPVAMDLSEPTVTFAVPQNILSEQVLLKVMASDGINTGSDVSAPISFRRNLETAGCFGPPMRLTDTPVDSSEQRIATAGSHAYMVWTESTQGETGTQLFFQSSADGGETWSAPRALYDSGYSSTMAPQIAAAGSDVYIAFGPPHPGGSRYDSKFIVSHDYGQNFSAPLILSENAGRPTLILDGNRVWIRTSLNNTIMVFRSTDGGDTFTALPDKTVYPTGWIRASAFAISGDNVYYAYSDETYALKLIRSTNGGTSYTSAATLASAPYTTYNLALKADGNNVYIAWDSDSLLSGTDKYLQFIKSTDSGQTFSAPVDLQQSSVGFEPPRIALAGTTIHLLWERWESAANSNRNVYHARSTDGGATFSSPANLSQTDQLATDGQIVAFGNKVYVAWMEDRLAYMGGTLMQGEIKARGSADGGESFGTIVNVSNTATVQSERPGMSVSGDTVLLHWREFEGVDTYLARSEPCSGSVGEGLNPTPVPPVLPAIGSRTVAEGTSTTLAITPSDENYDALTFQVENLPPFATMEDNGDSTATIILAPGFGQAGNYPGVTVTVSDGTHTASQTFDVTVTASNLPPLARPGGPYVVLEGNTLRFDGTASSDPEGTALSHTWTYRGQSHVGAVVEVSTSDDYAGSASLQVEDGNGVTQTAEVEVAVLNQPPTVVPARLGVRLATFVDPGTGDTHTATIDWGDGSAPTAGTVMEWDGSGSVSGTHRYAADGTYTVTVTVFDDDGATASVAFPVTVRYLFVPLTVRGGN